jgi:hypothetical protein
MPSILESILPAERIAAMHRGEEVTLSGDEVKAFQIRLEDVKSDRITALEAIVSAQALEIDRLKSCQTPIVKTLFPELFQPA